MTSADEAVGVPADVGLIHSPQPSVINSAGNHQSSPVSTAAGLLLALASASTPEQNSVPPYQHTPPHIDRVSRPCMACPGEGYTEVLILESYISGPEPWD